MKKKWMFIMLLLVTILPFLGNDGVMSAKARTMTKTWDVYEYVLQQDGTIAITRYNGNDKKVVIPNMIEGKRVTSIGKHAFSDLYISSVTIPKGVTSIGDGAFYGCSELTSITIPSSVKIIGVSAFMHCSNLSSITIPKTVTHIGDYAFKGCSKLKSIALSKGVTYIGHYAFGGCSNLTSVTIPVEDKIMNKLLEEMKKQCRMLNISTLISPQTEGSENVDTFIHFGFTEAWKSEGWVYLAMSI